MALDDEERIINCEGQEETDLFETPHGSGIYSSPKTEIACDKVGAPA
jgi:hypothetical protein